MSERSDSESRTGRNPCCTPVGAALRNYACVSMQKLSYKVDVLPVFIGGIHNPHSEVKVPPMGWLQSPDSTQLMAESSDVYSWTTCRLNVPDGGKGHLRRSKRHLAQHELRCREDNVVSWGGDSTKLSGKAAFTFKPLAPTLTDFAMHTWAQM